MLSIDPHAVARGTRPLFDLLNASQIAQLQHLKKDDELEERVRYLAERANEGELTSEEEAEYQGYIEANSVIALIQSAARQQSQQ